MAAGADRATGGSVDLAHAGVNRPRRLGRV